jgi:peptide-methionine (R)-S-oxide reductase
MKKTNRIHPVQLTDDQWKQKLTPEQYRILREKGTETPFTGKLLHNDKTGDYTCGACGATLFKSDAKYDSTTSGLDGWPSFADVASSDAVELADDNSLGMHRTEVICRTCGSHLGHLFDDDSSPTGQHYCINSAALDFKKKQLGAVFSAPVDHLLEDGEKVGAFGGQGVFGAGRDFGETLTADDTAFL